MALFINKQPRKRFGSWVSFYLHDIMLRQASFKDGGRFALAGGSMSLNLTKGFTTGNERLSGAIVNVTVWHVFSSVANVH